MKSRISSDKKQRDTKYGSILQGKEKKKTKGVEKKKQQPTFEEKKKQLKTDNALKKKLVFVKKRIERSRRLQ